MAEKKACAEKKHVAAPSCREGNHTYIVTNWGIGGGQQKARHMRCQHCLMPLDMQEIESMEWSKKEGL